MASGTKPTPRPTRRERLPIRHHSVAVVPCAEARGCFRWTILSDDGTCAERSAYAYATVSGARAIGEIRLREQRLGR